MVSTRWHYVSHCSQNIRKRTSRFGDQTWPASSCGLTALNFWDFLKSKVYVYFSETTQQFNEEIESYVHETPWSLLQYGFKNFIKRVHSCQRSRGNYLTDILVHINIYTSYLQHHTCITYKMLGL